MLVASGMTEEKADKDAIIYADDRFMEMKLKKSRTMTDDELKVHWHSEHQKMLVDLGMTEEEADKKATNYANDRFMEMKKNEAVIQMPRPVLGLSTSMKI